MSEKFESWAIVELMGHQRTAGKVSEEQIAGAALLRVDVPKTPRREEYTKFYSASAIYCITPTSEDIARRAAEAFDNPPIFTYDGWRPQSPAFIERTGDPDYEDDDSHSPDDEDESEVSPDGIPF